MEFGYKTRTVSGILSPEPRLLKLKLLRKKPNSCSKCVEDEKAISELQSILNKLDSPISKKTQSPFSFRNRPPTRQKINPIIYDAQFIEINSSASTFEDSQSLIS